MEFQAYLSQKYQGHESFLENIILPIFGEDHYETAYDVELLDSAELRNQAARTGIRSIIRCGTIDLDLSPIEVFDITVADRVMMEKNRVGVQAIIRRVMDTYSGAFMIIHYDNDVKWDWRFTFCRLRDKGEFTDNKRYTFLLGPNQACKTAAQNFKKLADLHQEISIQDIVMAFDVEALSKEFFDKYKNHYERFVEFITGKRFVKVGGKFVERASHEPDPKMYAAFGEDDKAVRDYVKRLLGRITLLHFVQKKGWLGVKKGAKWGEGDERFMMNLFKKGSDAQKADFVNEVLNPLFFEALDTDRKDKGDLFDTKVVGTVRIPYLNGGLFEKGVGDDLDVCFPAFFFEDLLVFFSEYNFTVDENDPNEAQVGIDPEMLGKIFENLLEDNKDKGAFYTPKEIVQYMCQESLIAYLVTKTGIEEDNLRAFVKCPEEKVTNLSEEEKYSILGAILSVKICDPAIGSGAFPIGLLNELVRCKEAIYGDEKGRADIKREIIRDNIYGVDVEKGAVDIARLRFWLSLIVDEDEPIPLPNLDFKIMQGDSLLEWYMGVDLKHLVDSGETDIFLSSAEDLKDELSKSLKKYFSETNHSKKKALKDRISKTIEKIFCVAGVDIPEGIDVAENNRFFLWHTWFNEVFANGGFDIVIGNPPYIEHKKLKGIADNLKDKYVLYSGTADFSVYFIERGFTLLKPNGVLCFITTNKFFNTGYGKRVRAYLAAKQINQLINFEQVEVFEDVLVSSVILNIYNRRQDIENLIVYERFYKLNYSEFRSTFIEKNGVFGTYPQEYLDDNEWSFADAFGLTLKKKIESGSYCMNEVPGIGIYRGITTGYNPAFIIDNEKRNELLSSDSKNGDIIKQMLQGRNIRRWYYNESEEYLLQTGFDIDIPNKYPSVYEHLSIFYEPMIARSDQGKNWWNLRACQYYDEFEVDRKIVWGLTADKWAFTLDSDKHYLPSNAYMLTSSQVPILYILGLLNSRVLQYYFSFIGVMTAGGAYTLKGTSISALPLRIVADTSPIEAVVSKILSCKQDDSQADVIELEEELNALVYSIYGLNDGEIATIDSFCKR